jgi:hypothetical protein
MIIETFHAPTKIPIQRYGYGEGLNVESEKPP